MSPRGSGWAPRGCTSLWVYRAARSRQARPEKARGASWGTAKGGMVGHHAARAGNNTLTLLCCSAGRKCAAWARPRDCTSIRRSVASWSAPSPTSSSRTPPSRPRASSAASTSAGKSTGAAALSGASGPMPRPRPRASAAAFSGAPPSAVCCTSATSASTGTVFATRAVKWTIWRGEPRLEDRRRMSTLGTQRSAPTASLRHPSGEGHLVGPGSALWGQEGPPHARARGRLEQLCHWRDGEFDHAAEAEGAGRRARARAAPWRRPASRPRPTRPPPRARAARHGAPQRPRHAAGLHWLPPAAPRASLRAQPCSALRHGCAASSACPLTAACPRPSGESRGLPTTCTEPKDDRQSAMGQRDAVQAARASCARVGQHCLAPRSRAH